MFATGETVGLAEWIIDDTCLVLHNSAWMIQLKQSRLLKKQ